MTNVVSSQRTASRPGVSGAASFLLLQFATMWGAFFILAPAINWPASLDEPPAIILPLILDQSTAVFAGYLSYLIHALALIPLAILLRDALRLVHVIQVRHAHADRHSAERRVHVEQPANNGVLSPIRGFHNGAAIEVLVLNRGEQRRR